ncbi:2-hydroxyacid dehydrogenase [Muricoccus radiodurans]|uniref:2-hydroxyacid dehydrogenase n=1 Tax=Muricoccus radiodurans TaxID=2231721 RepID=UPI003CF46E6B
MSETKERILILPPIPADLRTELAKHYDLTDDRTEPGLRIAVTSSMGGADDATMASIPGLRFIGCNGTGLDRFDLPAARRRGIAVCNTPDELTEDVADFAIGLIYATLRRMAESDRFVRAGTWSGGARMSNSVRVSGKMLGIVGMGRIGQTIARKATGVGMSVAWNGPRPKPDLSYAYVPDLMELARASDVLLLVMPASPATQGVVNAAVLEALGPKGYLINIARGSVVDEAALLHALETNAIAGAGLDVFAREPGLDPRFLKLENAVLTPHYAALTNETRAAMIGRILSDIAAFREGRPFRDAATA